MEAFGFDMTKGGKRALLLEMDLEALAALAKPLGRIKELPRYPAVARDIALVVPESQPLGPMLQAIREAAGPLLEEASLFDVYRGQGVTGKSAAFSLVFRAPDRTLQDAEVAARMEDVLAACKARFGAALRA